MNVQKIPFETTQSFSSFFLDYIHQKESLKPFYHRFPTPENFKHQLAEKSASFSKANREVLAKALSRQYESFTLHDTVKANLESLTREKTFTITTGHQLNIFTGPLYFIYKIVTVINTCKKLKEVYPEYSFVPVYWMASEDHDYDEIKSFRLYGKKYTWETNQRGAVGRFNTSDFKALLKDIPGDIKIFSEAYTKYSTLADAVRHYVSELFGEEGLVVIDGDDRELKQQFIPVIEDDLFNHTAKASVDVTDDALGKVGYKTQVHCRPVNFFYLEDGMRNRLEKVGNICSVVDTTRSFTESEIREMIQHSPEKFSPNVILRPLYQEMILPNLAYVGGPAEIVYWLQLKGVFDQFKIPFPILMPRNFALVVDGATARKLDKTKLEITDFFKDKEQLFTHAVLNFTDKNIRLEHEKECITSHFKTIQENAASIDVTLGPLVGAETKRAIRSIEKIEQKLLKAEKRLQSDWLQQIEAVRDTLFPNGILQERSENFLNFYQQDPKFIAKLLYVFDPFDFTFTVLRYP
jgi:bacillithiol synthase